MCVRSLALDKPAVVGVYSFDMCLSSDRFYCGDSLTNYKTHEHRVCAGCSNNSWALKWKHLFCWGSSSGKSTESNRIPVLQQCKHHTMMYAVQIICANDFVSSCLECGCVQLTDRGHWWLCQTVRMLNSLSNSFLWLLKLFGTHPVLLCRRPHPSGAPAV